MPKKQPTQAEKYQILIYMRDNKDTLSGWTSSDIASRIKKDLKLEASPYLIRTINKEGNIGINIKRRLPSNVGVTNAELSSRINELERLVDHLYRQLGVNRSSVLQEEPSNS